MDDLHHFANQRNQQQLKERLNSLEERLRQQDSKQAEREEWQKLLYNESVRLDANIEALTTEHDIGKLEQISAELAFDYETNHTELLRIFNPDNYPSLEYKELATKCADRLQNLRNLEWYEWGKKQTKQQVEQHFQNLAAIKEKKKAALEAPHDFWKDPWVLFSVALVVVGAIICIFCWLHAINGDPL